MMDLQYKQQDFNRKKKQKAFAYTAAVCATLFLLFILISWKTSPPAPPVVQDELEINLGNDMEGFGEEQPLIKGEMGEQTENPIPEPTVQQQEEEPTPVLPEENATEDAAPVKKIVKTIPATTKKINTVITPITKPSSKPRYQYNGGAKGNGNNADKDNGYTMQGNNKNGTGDNGSPKGNPDSYGNTPGGAVGGVSVIKGSRKITAYPGFTSDLPKATIYADVNVSASGAGSFIKIVKPSTSFSNAYAERIKIFLRTIKFNTAGDENVVTVRFNFTVQ